MKSQYLIFVLLIFWGNIYAQNCFQVIDKSTERGISFATISFNKSGFYADENGKFCFENQPPIDSILISALGYKTLRFSLTEFNKNHSFQLESIPILLNTVEVRTNKSNIKILSAGYFKKKGSRSALIPNSNMPLATFVKNELGQDGIIEKIQISVRPYSYEGILAYKIRLRLYKNTSDNLPSDDLLPQNILVDLPPNTKNIEQEVLKYAIRFPKEGLWIGVETLGYFDENKIFIQSKDNKIGINRFDKNSKPLSPHFNCKKRGDVGTLTKFWGGDWKSIFKDSENKYFSMMVGLTYFL